MGGVVLIMTHKCPKFCRIAAVCLGFPGQDSNPRPRHFTSTIGGPWWNRGDFGVCPLASSAMMTTTTTSSSPSSPPPSRRLRRHHQRRKVFPDGGTGSLDTRPVCRGTVGDNPHSWVIRRARAPSSPPSQHLGSVGLGLFFQGLAGCRHRPSDRRRGEARKEPRITPPQCSLDPGRSYPQRGPFASTRPVAQGTQPTDRSGGGVLLGRCGTVRVYPPRMDVLPPSSMNRHVNRGRRRRRRRLPEMCCHRGNKLNAQPPSRF